MRFLPVLLARHTPVWKEEDAAHVERQREREREREIEKKKREKQRQRRRRAEERKSRGNAGLQQRVH